MYLTLRCSVLVAYCCDYVADWEPWLPATTQHHESILYCISLGWEKIKFQNLKYAFCGMYSAFIQL